MNVLADREVTTKDLAQKLEILESQWSTMKSLVNVLEPIMLTKVLCSEDSPASMVPLGLIANICLSMIISVM